MDVEIRVLKKDEWEIFAKVVSQAYGIKDNRILKIVVDINYNVQDDGCLAAFFDDEPLGVGCFFQYEYLAWIGYMGVTPRSQRRGVGTALLRSIINELFRRNVRTIRLDASSAGYPLYRKFGFVDEYPTAIYEISRILKKKRCKNIEILKDLDEEIISKDFEAFGVDRSRAIRAWLDKGAKILKIPGGYALLKMDTIGPLIAEDGEVAECLIYRAYDEGYRKIIVPEGNNRAVELIRSLGGVAVHRIMRMRYGESINEKIDKIYGILDFAKG